jgi:hypothetical protein
MTCDPHYNDVVLLLHGEGTNGSHSFPDSSSYAHALSLWLGNAAVDTSLFKYGAGSINVNTTPGGSDALYVNPAGPEWDVSAGNDFTVEAWINHAINNGVAGTLFYLHQTSPGKDTLEFGLDSNHFVRVTGAAAGGGTVVAISGSTVVTPGVWHHVAVVRTGGVYKVFLDGVEEASAAGTGPLVAADVASVGSHYDGSSGSIFFVANIDEFRFTNGFARYTGAFTPPTAAFDDVACPTGPTITVQPTDQSVLSAFSATFAVTATTASPPLTYQWYRDAVLIPGATAASYTTPLTVPADSGAVFTVVVDDASHNPVTSNPATLTVTPAVVGYATPFLDERFPKVAFMPKLNLSEFVYYPMRPSEDGVDTAPAVPNMIINRYKQQSTETRQRGVDFTLFCTPGEVLKPTGIEVVAISPTTTPPLAVSNLLIDPDGQKFAYDVSGGVDGTEYLVQFRATFNSGQIANEEVVFQIGVFAEDVFP